MFQSQPRCTTSFYFTHITSLQAMEESFNLSRDAQPLFTIMQLLFGKSFRRFNLSRDAQPLFTAYLALEEQAFYRFQSQPRCTTSFYPHSYVFQSREAQFQSQPRCTTSFYLFSPDSIICSTEFQSQPRCTTSFYLDAEMYRRGLLLFQSQPRCTTSFYSGCLAPLLEWRKWVFCEAHLYLSSRKGLRHVLSLLYTILPFFARAWKARLALPYTLRGSERGKSTTSCLAIRSHCYSIYIWSSFGASPLPSISTFSWQVAHML